MPDWAVHTIVPLFALLLVSQKENPKYILYLLPPNGYVINSVGAASITFLLMAGMCLYYRNRSNNDNNEVFK